MAAAGLGLFSLYLLSFPDVYSDAYILIDDGVWYVRMVETRDLFRILHPNHLLYHLQPFALYSLLVRWMSSVEASLLAHRLVDAAYGVAGALLLRWTVLRISGDRWAAALAAAGLAASASYWFHAALPENAIGGAVGLMVVLVALAHAVERPSPGRCAALGLAHALAVLLRQDGVLAIPLVVGALLAAAAGRERLRALAAYAVPLAAVVGLAYGAAYLFVIGPRATAGPEARFLTWARSSLTYADWGRWDFVTPANAWYVLRAFLHAVSPAAGQAALLLPLAASLGVLAAELAPPGLGRWWAWAGGCLAWFALRVAFYTWFDPQNSFMWGLGSLPAVWLAFGLLVAAARRTPRARAAAIACVALVAAGTVGGVVLPARGHAYAEEAAVWRQATGPGDLIFSNNFSLYHALVYMTERKMLALPRVFHPYWYNMTEGDLTALVEARRRTGAVYLTADVDARHETWIDFVAGPRGRFERRVPLPADGPRIAAFLDRYRWTPVMLGATSTGPVLGRRLDGP